MSAERSMAPARESGRQRAFVYLLPIICHGVYYEELFKFIRIYIYITIRAARYGPTRSVYHAKSQSRFVVAKKTSLRFRWNCHGCFAHELLRGVVDYFSSSSRKQWFNDNTVADISAAKTNIPNKFNQTSCRSPSNYNLRVRRKQKIYDEPPTKRKLPKNLQTKAFCLNYYYFIWTIIQTILC